MWPVRNRKETFFAGFFPYKLFYVDLKLLVERVRGVFIGPTAPPYGLIMKKLENLNIYKNWKNGKIN